tara:strand:- start:3969 stop:4610 length:642 start_codon:yes stop_codon:yes gene_type:complete
MIEKGKLSFWDVGTYLMIGFLSSVCAVAYLFWGRSFDFSVYIELLKSISGVLIVILPIWFLLLGMFVEPIANIACKWLEKAPLLKPRKSHHQESVVRLISKLLPDEDIRKDNPYRFCKSVVELKCPNSNHEVFLARFGFYRSLGFIFFLSTFMSFIVLGFGCGSTFVAFVCAILGVVFLKRSQIFLNHMSDAVYFNYAALVYGDSVMNRDKDN